MSLLSGHEKALARGRGYSLLGLLWRRPVDGPLREAVLEVESLRDHCPSMEAIESGEAAAQHHRLVALEVFPHASVFLDPEGQMGGDAAEATSEFGRRIGFSCRDVSSDHLGALLGAMAHLCAGEADARRDHVPLPALQGHQALLLDSYVASWLPPFVAAVEVLRDPFYGRLAELTGELVRDHGTELEEEGVLSISPVAAGEMKEPSGEETRGKPQEIAGILLSPVRSGVFLSRSEISNWARAADVPRGFGSRRDMLERLWESGHRYGNQGDVHTGLRGWCEHRVTHYRSWGEWGLPWLERVQRTEAWLGRFLGLPGKA